LQSKIGKFIEESGYPNRYIAKKVGVNENTVRNWKNGTWPRFDKVILLADLFNCKTDDLYERTDT